MAIIRSTSLSARDSSSFIRTRVKNGPMRALSRAASSCSEQPSAYSLCSKIYASAAQAFEYRIN